MQEGIKRENFLLMVSAVILILALIICFLPLFVQGQEANSDWLSYNSNEQLKAPLGATEAYDAPESLLASAASPEPVITPLQEDAEETPETTTVPAASPATVVDEQPAPAATEELLRGLQVNVQVTNQGTTPSRNIRMEIPMLAEMDSPYQALLDESFSHQPAELSGREMGGRIMVLEIPSLNPGVSEMITLDYTLAARHPEAGISLAPEGLSQYLAPSPKVESDHPEIMALANRIILNSRSDHEKAMDIYSYVIGHMNYNLDASSRNQGALSALKSSQGVCEEYASLFVALSRAAGIPARVVNGYADPRGTGEIWNLSPDQSLPLGNYRHAWVEFYVEDKGWQPADPTFESAPNSYKYFGTLPHGAYIAQNYHDQSLRARSQGGQLAITWNEVLVN